MGGEANCLSGEPSRVSGRVLACENPAAHAARLAQNQTSIPCSGAKRSYDNNADECRPNRPRVVCRKRPQPHRMNPTENVWTAETRQLRSDRMSKRTLTVLGAFALAAGLFALSQLAGRAGDVKLVVPAAAVTDMVKSDIDVVTAALAGKDGKAPLP